jgi:hypothetical protein
LVHFKIRRPYFIGSAENTNSPVTQNAVSKHKNLEKALCLGMFLRKGLQTGCGTLDEHTPAVFQRDAFEDHW